MKWLICLSLMCYAACLTLGVGASDAPREGHSLRTSQNCTPSGSWFYSANRSVTMSIAPAGSGGAAYTVTATGTSPGWRTADLVLSAMPYARSGWKATFAFHSAGNDGDGSGGVGLGASVTAVLDGTCDVINQWSNGSPPWCAADNPSCRVAPPFSPHSAIADFFSAPRGAVHLMEVSHSDIFWRGKLNDMLIDSAEIAAALDIMANNTRQNFRWQHECMLFWRAFIEIYPEREAELVQRVAEGSFDIGGTFTEGFESTMHNELLVRQMYEGRRWFLDRYGHIPGVDSAVVAFHQDGPLRALQMPQVYAKAGMRFLKASRLSDHIFRWASPDGSSLLAFEEVHYGEPLATSDDLLARMAEWWPQFSKGSFPPIMHLAPGSDYYDPRLETKFMDEWSTSNGSAAAAFGDATRVPSVEYSTFNRYLSSLEAAPGFNPPVFIGQRPNLWYAETSPTDHWLFTNWREAGRRLPAAETWATFQALVAGTWDLYPSALLAEAWLNATLNDHGLGHESTPYNMPCKDDETTPMLCSLVRPNSPPYANWIYRLKFMKAREAADAMIADAQQWLADATQPNRSDTVVVFNSLSWARNDPVTIAVPASLHRRASSAGLHLVVRDSSGACVPSQATHGNSSQLVFVAAVPSLGFASYSVDAEAAPCRPAQGSAPRPGQAWTTSYSNNFWRISPGRGGIASMVELSSGHELFDTTEFMVSFERAVPARDGALTRVHEQAGEWMSLAYTTNGASETQTYRHPRTSGPAGADSGTPTFNASTQYFQRLGNISGWSGWTCVETGAVRTVFATHPVAARDSKVVLTLAVYEDIPRVDINASLLDWDDAFGVTNRLVFPVAGATQAPFPRNVTIAVPFGAVRVGEDEMEGGDIDTWLQHPGAAVPKFERGWSMRPREVQDWVHAEGAAGGCGVMVSTSVGLVDWQDASGTYSQNATVLSPELLWHTNSNMGPFTNETGDHHFRFSIITTPPGAGWRAGWRRAVQANQPLTAKWATPSQSATRGFTLPRTSSLLSFEDGKAPNLWVTALKREDVANISRVFSPTEQLASKLALQAASPGVILRLFDMEGTRENTMANAVFAAQIARVVETNIIERDAAAAEPQRLSVVGGNFSVTVGPWAIETLKLSLATPLVSSEL